MNREQARVADWRQRAKLAPGRKREDRDRQIADWRRRIGFTPLKS